MNLQFQAETFSRIFIYFILTLIVSTSLPANELEVDSSFIPNMKVILPTKNLSSCRLFVFHEINFCKSLTKTDKASLHPFSLRETLTDYGIFMIKEGDVYRVKKFFNERWRFYFGGQKNVIDQCNIYKAQGGIEFCW